MDPPVDWPTWASTLKLAIMAKDSINVETLLRQKPDAKDLFYHTEPTYKPPTEKETQAQHSERELGNNKRKVDWENDCKAIEFKGPTVDGIPWDEADTKIKTLFYLSRRTEGQRIYHQRFPHSIIDQISAFELAHEFSLSFTRPRNRKYNRFLLFTCKQKENDILENFHCRHKAIGAKWRLGTPEDDLIKDLFIAFMSDADFQRELLIETKTPIHVLQFALNYERGQENQRAINNQLNCQLLLLPDKVSFVQRNPRQTTYIRSQQTQSTAITPIPCRRCGVQFTLEHLQICPAKKVQCNFCKKKLDNKVCRSAKLIWQGQQIIPQQNNPPTLSVTNIRETTTSFLLQQHTHSYSNPEHDTHTEPTDETSDPENTFFIQEIFNNWNTVNIVKLNHSTTSTPQNASPNNPTKYGHAQHPTTLKSIG